MKKALFIFAALAMLGVPARAADLLVKAPPQTQVSAWSWTGFYLGGHVGGAWSKSDWFEDAAGFPVGFQDASISSSSFISGGQIGFDYQAGWAVFGLQADADLASLVGTVSGANCFPENGGDQSCTTHIKSMGTVAARIGACLRSDAPLCPRWVRLGARKAGQRMSRLQHRRCARPV